MSDTPRTEIESIKAKLNQRLHERTQAHLKSYRELKDQNIDLVKESQRLREALELANAAMNHMGEILNGMDAIEDEDLELCNPAFLAVQAILESLAPEPSSNPCQLGEPVSNADELDSDHPTWFPCMCLYCDWLGMSNQALDAGEDSDPLCPKCHHVIESLGRRETMLANRILSSIPRADVEPLVRALHRVVVDESYPESDRLRQAEEALATFTAKHGGGK